MTKLSIFLIGSLLSLILVATPILAVSYTISVQTDYPTYSGVSTMHITGKVLPAPGPNTAAFVSVLNPNGKPVDYGDEQVDANTGAFSHSTVTGGAGPLAALWISGTYTVNASWGSSGTAVYQTATFAYTATTTTTTTTSTSTTTSSTTSTTTTSTATTTTSSTTTKSSTSTSTGTSTTSTSSTVPEFNPTALLIVSLVALAAIAVVGRTRLNKGPALRT